MSTGVNPWTGYTLSPGASPAGHGGCAHAGNELAGAGQAPAGSHAHEPI